jgi:hypothetical protein
MEGLANDYDLLLPDQDIFNDELLRVPRAPYVPPQVHFYVDYRLSMLRSEESRSQFAPRRAPYMLAPPANLVSLVPLAAIRGFLVRELQRARGLQPPLGTRVLVTQIDAEIVAEKRETPMGGVEVEVAPRVPVYTSTPTGDAFAIAYDAEGNGPEHLALALLGLPDGLFDPEQHDLARTVQRLLYGSYAQRAEVFEQDTHWHDRLVVQTRIPADEARAVRGVVTGGAKRRGKGEHDAFIYDEQCARVTSWAYAVRYVLNSAPYALPTGKARAQPAETPEGAERLARLFPFVSQAYATGNIAPYFDNELPHAGADRLHRVVYTGGQGRGSVRTPLMRFPYAQELGAAQLALNEELTGRASGGGRIVSPAVYQRALEVSAAGMLSLTYRACTLRLYVRYRFSDEPADGPVYEIANPFMFAADFAPFDHSADQTATTLRPYRVAPMPEGGGPVPCPERTPENAHALAFVDRARSDEQLGRADYPWRVTIVQAAPRLRDELEASMGGFPRSVFEAIVAHVLESVDAIHTRRDELLEALDFAPRNAQRRLVPWALVGALVRRLERQHGGALVPEAMARASFARLRDDLRAESLAGASRANPFPAATMPMLLTAWEGGPRPWTSAFATTVPAPRVAAPPAAPLQPSWSMEDILAQSPGRFSPPAPSPEPAQRAEPLPIAEASVPAANAPMGTDAPAPAEVDDAMELDAPFMPEYDDVPYPDYPYEEQRPPPASLLPVPPAPAAAPLIVPPPPSSPQTPATSSPMVLAPRSPQPVAPDPLLANVSDALRGAEKAFFVAGTSELAYDPLYFLVGRAGVWRVGDGTWLSEAHEQSVEASLWRLHQLGMHTQTLLHEELDLARYGHELLLKRTDLVPTIGRGGAEALEAMRDEFAALVRAHGTGGEQPMVDPVEDIVATMLPLVNAALPAGALPIAMVPAARHERTHWVTEWAVSGDYARVSAQPVWSVFKRMLEYHGFSLQEDRLLVLFGDDRAAAPAATRWLERNGYFYSRATSRWEYDFSRDAITSDVFRVRITMLPTRRGESVRGHVASYAVLARAARTPMGATRGTARGGRATPEGRGRGGRGARGDSRR